MGASEEIVSPFPPGLSAATSARACRSTLLLTSINALKARGLYEQYARAVPPEALAAITSAVVGMWLPMELGLAHYAACETLALTPNEQEEIGAEVVRNLQKTFLGTLLRAAGTTVAITPWTGLSRFSTIYSRVFQGSGTQVVKTGPKDARTDAVGLPLATNSYFRNAYRGFIRSGCEFFASRVFVTELPRLRSGTSLSYRISWV